MSAATRNIIETILKFEHLKKKKKKQDQSRILIIDIYKQNESISFFGYDEKLYSYYTPQNEDWSDR